MLSQGEFWDKQYQFTQNLHGAENAAYLGWPHLCMSDKHLWIETCVGYHVLAITSGYDRLHGALLELRNWIVVAI